LPGNNNKWCYPECVTLVLIYHLLDIYYRIADTAYMIDTSALSENNLQIIGEGYGLTVEGKILTIRRLLAEVNIETEFRYETELFKMHQSLELLEGLVTPEVKEGNG